MNQFHRLPSKVVRKKLLTSSSFVYGVDWIFHTCRMKRKHGIFKTGVGGLLCVMEVLPDDDQCIMEDHSTWNNNIRIYFARVVLIV